MCQAVCQAVSVTPATHTLCIACEDDTDVDLQYCQRDPPLE